MFRMRLRFRPKLASSGRKHMQTPVMKGFGEWSYSRDGPKTNHLTCVPMIARIARARNIFNRNPLIAFFLAFMKHEWNTNGMRTLSQISSGRPWASYVQQNLLAAPGQHRHTSTAPEPHDPLREPWRLGPRRGRQPEGLAESCSTPGRRALEECKPGQGARLLAQEGAEEGLFRCFWVLGVC